MIASTQESSILLEQIQEKNEEIERLQDLLEKEKEMLNEAHKEIADLKEAYSIAEERTANAIQDREKFQDKNRDHI